MTDVQRALIAAAVCLIAVSALFIAVVVVEFAWHCWKTRHLNHWKHWGGPL